ncbi:hypothetical protein NX059_005137 [Plenodomus lindquistii]|nr:hypothetical protein NX059_005137 [Plenodomus lindquistii]
MAARPSLNFPHGMLAGQTAIITGAAQGIGAETAAILAREGCKIVIADLDAGTFCSVKRYGARSILIQDSAKAERTAEAINSDGGKAIAVAGDITNNEAVDKLVLKAAAFGDGKIHIIINNAGYAWDDPIDKIQDKQWGELLFPTDSWRVSL